jgi:hypothetical protein
VVAVPDAAAISRKRADAVAVTTLRPDARRGRVVLFGLPQPVSARQSIAIASPSRLGLVVKKQGLKPSRRTVWLYWLDLAFEAKFEHPSTLLLVDDATGRVIYRRALSYYPLVDGRRPPFLRTPQAYRSGRYRVAANVPARAAATAAPRVPQARTFLPPNAFAHDCLLMIGLWNDAGFEQDFTDLARTTRALGIRTWYASSTDSPSANRPADHTAPEHLGPNVRRLVQDEDCTDVVIYADGHGAKAPEPVGVTVGEDMRLTPNDLADILKANPEATFKLKIDACYAGRFLEDANLRERANLVFMEAAAAAGEAAYSYLSLSTRDPATPNPGRSEFTNANIYGITRFVQSDDEISRAQAAGGSLLVRMLERAFVLGASADGAQRKKLTHPPTPYVNVGSAQPSLNIAVWWWHPPNADFSYLCIEWFSTGASDLRLSYSGGDRADSSETTLNLSDPPGPRHGVTGLKIFAYGTYRIGATLFTADGRRLDRTATVTVTEAQGGPPCGG